jgi:hypothetical protein
VAAQAAAHISLAVLVKALMKLSETMAATEQTHSVVAVAVVVAVVMHLLVATVFLEQAVLAETV